MIDLLPIKQKSNININNLFSLDTCKLGVMWVIYDINKKMIIDYGSSKPNVYPKNRIKPSSEIDLHLLLYKERNELSSIVHCHSNWASILSCLRVNILSFHYMVAEFGGDDIKCSKYATFGTKKLAKFVVNSAKNRNGCLIANHGQICFGKNIKEAMHFSQALEKLSKQYYFCILSKKLKKLNKKEMNEVLKIFPSYKSKD